MVHTQIPMKYTDKYCAGYALYTNKTIYQVVIIQEIVDTVNIYPHFSCTKSYSPAFKHIAASSYIHPFS